MSVATKIFASAATVIGFMASLEFGFWLMNQSSNLTLAAGPLFILGAAIAALKIIVCLFFPPINLKGQ